VRRQLWFMGRWMRHGGMYPTYSMRAWRHGDACCEIRDLDEHMILRRGVAERSHLDIIDDPLSIFQLGRQAQPLRDPRGALRHRCEGAGE
jgi:hypothetical protein